MSKIFKFDIESDHYIKTTEDMENYTVEYEWDQGYDYHINIYKYRKRDIPVVRILLKEDSPSNYSYPNVYHLYSIGEELMDQVMANDLGYVKDF